MCEVKIIDKASTDSGLDGRFRQCIVQDRPHISHMCVKASLPPPLFSASKIDGSRLAVPARHPVPHMLAAMFSHPAQLEADTEMRHLNTYRPYTLYLSHAGCMSSLFQECVLYVTPLLHCIHSNECDPSAPHRPPEMSFDADGFLYGQQLIQTGARARKTQPD